MHVSCSRLSDNGGERKIGASEEKNPVGIGDVGRHELSLQLRSVLIVLKIFKGNFQNLVF